MKHMHDPIHVKLEAYLEDPSRAGKEFQEHMEACGDCAREVGRISEQSALLRSLRSPEAEPNPGFYGRVMARIEAQARPSVWSMLLDNAFGRRVAFASAAMFLLMAGYLISTEPGDFGANAAGASIVAVSDATPADGTLTLAQQPDQDRNSVLVNLASFRE